MIHLKRSMAAIALSGISIGAMASDYYSDARPLWDIHPYLGIEANSTDFELADKRVTMLGVVTGLQFNDYLGLELNWSQSIDKLDLYTSNTSGDKVKFADNVQVQTYGVAVTFQADLYQRLYLKSHVGVNRIDADVEALKDDVGVAKLGLGYQFTPDVAAEVTYNYNFSKNDTANDGVGFQLKYYF